jgi:hypothetical protein
VNRLLHRVKAFHLQVHLCLLNALVILDLRLFNKLWMKVLPLTQWDRLAFQLQLSEPLLSYHSAAPRHLHLACNKNSRLNHPFFLVSQIFYLLLQRREQMDLQAEFLILLLGLIHMG